MKLAWASVRECHQSSGSPVSLVSDREQRVVSDLNTSYLSAEALADVERLGVELADGQPLTVRDYDADENGNPT